MAKNYSNKENNRNMANNNASENGYSSYADEQNRNSKTAEIQIRQHRKTAIETARIPAKT